MPYHYADYPARARRLADAAENLLEAVSDPEIDRALAVVDLETAATTVAPANLELRFEAAGGAPAGEPPASPEDVLSALLLELQSANSLMGAGIALNEHGKGADPQYLNQSVAQIRSSGTVVAAHISASATLQFAPQKEPSADVDAAKALFKDSAGRSLKQISSGTTGIINTAIDELKKLDKSKVLESIDKLGKSFDVVAKAGKLIRRGLEALKKVLDGLSNLVGGELISKMKEKVKEIWDNFTSGKYTAGLVDSIIGVADAEKTVGDYAVRPGLQISGLDSLSRELAFLDDKYQGKRKILDGFMTGIGLALAIVGALQVFGLFAATPWIILAGAGAYATMIGAALLVGMNYTGSRPLVSWTRGVCVILQDPRPPR